MNVFFSQGVVYGSMEFGEECQKAFMGMFFSVRIMTNNATGILYLMFKAKQTNFLSVNDVRKCPFTTNSSVPFDHV